MRTKLMQYKAKKLISRLKRMNYNPVVTPKKGNTLVVHVDAPVRELEGISIEIIEKNNGITRRIRAVNYASCCIFWEL